MSFQAYLDTIEKKTGLTPRELVDKASEKGFGPGTGCGMACGKASVVVTYGFSQMSSVMGLPIRIPRASYLVVGRCTEIGRSASAEVRFSVGSASPTSAICTA